MFAQHQLATRIKSQAIAARFLAVVGHSGVASWLHEDCGTDSFLPFHHRIVGDVGEQHEATIRIPHFRHPDRALCPLEPSAQHFDLCITRDQAVERRFKPIHSSDVWKVGRVLCFASADQQCQNSKERSACFHFLSLGCVLMRGD